MQMQMQTRRCQCRCRCICVYTTTITQSPKRNPEPESGQWLMAVGQRSQPTAGKGACLLKTLNIHTCASSSCCSLDALMWPAPAAHLADCAKRNHDRNRPLPKAFGPTMPYSLDLSSARATTRIHPLTTVPFL